MIVSCTVSLFYHISYLQQLLKLNFRDIITRTKEISFIPRHNGRMTVLVVNVIQLNYISFLQFFVIRSSNRSSMMPLSVYTLVLLNIFGRAQAITELTALALSFFKLACSAIKLGKRSRVCWKHYSGSIFCLFVQEWL